MPSLFELLYSFFLIGLFTVGGGMAAIPLVQEYAVGKGWVTLETFYQMVAIAESTPGPIGINMATYVGYQTYGVLGGIITSLGMVLPSFIIILLLAKFFAKYTQTPVVKAVFYGLRACIVGLVGYAAYKVISISLLDTTLFAQTGNILDVFNLKAIAIFGVILFLYLKFKKHPIIYIALGAVLGIIFL